MELGWVDFSDEDRDKTLAVIQLLHEKGAVDELGIGKIRDGFANYFFPGTSTIQTRAKYFLLVPYILKETVEGKSKKGDKKEILQKIDEKEKECALKLLETGGDGIIGKVSLPEKWVSRPPSVIYWSGIKQLGIFKNQYSSMSISQYVMVAGNQKKQKQSIYLGNRNDKAEENETDDKDAGVDNMLHFWNLPTYHENWSSNLNIKLLPEEASFLKRQIIKEAEGTLFSCVLQNNIAVDEYPDFISMSKSPAVSSNISEELGKMLSLANLFNRLYHLANIRYNVLLHGDGGTQNGADTAWKEDFTDDYIAELPSEEDLKEIYLRLQISDECLTNFLKNILGCFKSKDIDSVDKYIAVQEKHLKHERAKLDKPGKLDLMTWLGSSWLDYRFYTARRIIDDIYEGEEKTNV